MKRPTCGYCYRRSITYILVKTWFGWRQQWRPVCANHIRTENRRGRG